MYELDVNATLVHIREFFEGRETVKIINNKRTKRERVQTHGTEAETRLGPTRISAIRVSEDQN